MRSRLGYVADNVATVEGEGMTFYIVVGLFIVGNFYLWFDSDKRSSFNLWTAGFLCGMFVAKLLG